MLSPKKSPKLKIANGDIGEAQRDPRFTTNFSNYQCGFYILEYELAVKAHWTSCVHEQ